MSLIDHIRRFNSEKGDLDADIGGSILLKNINMKHED
jgi:hypothetical protein